MARRHELDGRITRRNSHDQRGPVEQEADPVARYGDVTST